MNTRGPMRFARCGVVFAFVLSSGQARGQSQPATIRTVVAQAMSIGSPMFGTPRYFDGRTPTDWPAALVPPGAKVLGGGVIGDSAMFRMQTAVFEFAGPTDPQVAIRALLTRAGYAPHNPEVMRSSRGGFVESGQPTEGVSFCKGGSLAMFGVVDSAQSPMVFAVQLIEGEAWRHNCAPQGDRMGPDRMVNVPTLSPPSGAKSFGGGSSWSGSSGKTQSTLLTTLGADSILFHYTSQLVAGGWKAEGRPAVGSEVAAQRFSFRDGEVAWAAALIITAVGEKREVLLSFLRRD